jgi:hypothetical protein
MGERAPDPLAALLRRLAGSAASPRVRAWAGALLTSGERAPARDARRPGRPRPRPRRPAKQSEPADM